MKVAIVFLYILTFNTVLAGNVYKCKNIEGHVTFQSTPCINKKQQTRVMSYQTDNSPSKQCKAQCRADKMTCIARAGVREFSEHDQCYSERKLCLLGCNNPALASQIRNNNAKKRALKLERERNAVRKKDRFERGPIPSTGGGFYLPAAGGYWAPNGDFCADAAGGLSCPGGFVPAF